MRILLVSSEVHPYSKTGGLADMVGALAKTLARLGHEVGVLTPLYSGIREKFPGLEPARISMDLPLGDRIVEASLLRLEPQAGLTVYFLEKQGFFDRSGLYQENGKDYPDNAQRFIFFSKAAVNLAGRLPDLPDVLHLHDWQAAFAALLLHNQKRLSPKGRGPACCLTIHNLAYQGVFPAGQYPFANLPWEYFKPDGVEYYGQLNCLKAGIVFADALTTVSPRYASEITTPEFGCGLDGLMRARQAALTGILNGVDYDEWKATGNPYLHHSFGPDDLSGKTAGKLDLQAELGLPVDAGVPLFATIGRLVDQKGVDILLGALEEMLGTGMQFALLGSGAPHFQDAFQGLSRRFPRQVAARIGFDQGLAHRIEAGCDFFVMPSRFEPCGLNQMYSLRYAGIPIVRATGGLDDSVIDLTEDLHRANGIKFHEYSASALAKGIRKALALFGEPELLARYRHNAMSAEFSWQQTAAGYEEVYRRAMQAGR